MDGHLAHIVQDSYGLVLPHASQQEQIQPTTFEIEFVKRLFLSSHKDLGSPIYLRCAYATEK